MSEEKNQPEALPAEEPAVHESVPRKEAKPVQPLVALGLLIVALLLILIVINVRSRRVGVASDDPAVASLRADLEARRSELNRQRISLGLAPIDGASEPVEDIAARLTKDASTLVALSKSFQEMIAEKDREVTAKNEEILRSEKLRQHLASESARLQGELQRALVNGSDGELLRREVADLKAQRDALAADLNLAKQRLADFADGLPGEDVQDLKRQLEEATRAKSFFENRVQELEKASAR